MCDHGQGSRDHTRDVWLSTWIRHAIRDADSVYTYFPLTVPHRDAMHFSHFQPLSLWLLPSSPLHILDYVYMCLSLLVYLALLSWAWIGVYLLYFGNLSLTTPLKKVRPAPLLALRVNISSRRNGYSRAPPSSRMVCWWTHSHTGTGFTSSWKQQSCRAGDSSFWNTSPYAWALLFFQPPFPKLSLNLEGVIE